MSIRTMRSRTSAVTLLLMLLLGVLAGVVYFAATPSSAITEPTEDDPSYDGAPLTMDDPAEVTSMASAVFSGSADPLDEVTVELIAPTSGSWNCVVTAGDDGRWACTLYFGEAGLYEVQAYRDGGLYTDHFDSALVVYTGAASISDVGPLPWNGSYTFSFDGNRTEGSGIDFLVDGNVVAVIDGGSGWSTGAFSCGNEANTDWTCWIDAVGHGLAEGTHQLTIQAWVQSGEARAFGNQVSVALVVDTVAPGMASLTWPGVAEAEYRAPTDTLPRLTVTDRWQWFEGRGTPGDTVYVQYFDGDHTDWSWLTYSPPLCSATVNSEGWWWCGADGTWPSDSTITVGTWSEDPAGNQTPWGEQSGQLILDFLEGPVTPAITSPNPSASVVGSTVTIRGTGAVGDEVALFKDNGGGNYTFYCGDDDFDTGWNFWVENGTWSCTIDSLPYGQHTLFAAAVQQDWGSAGYSDEDPAYYTWSDVTEVSFRLVAPPVPPAPATTTTVKQPIQFTVGLTDEDGNPLDPSDIKPGTRVYIKATDLPPGAVVDVELHSDPVQLGTATVDEAGVLNLLVSIPEDVEPGAHNLVVTMTPVDGVPSTVSVPVGVVAVEAAEDPVVDEPIAEPADAGGEEAAAGGGIATGDSSGGAFAEPSTIGSTLQTAGDVRITATTLAVVGAMALALVVLVALPSELLQSTIGANYARMFGWLAPVTAKGKRARDRIPAWVRDRRVTSALTVAVTAFVLCFADPTFGFSASSFRLWLAIFASLFAVNVLILSIIRTVARRRYGTDSILDPMPGAIVIVALSVLVSRLANIEPGFLFGLVVGVLFTRELMRIHEGRLAALGAILLISLGIVSWLIYSVLPGPESSSVLVQFTRDFTAATTLEALSTMLIALLPLAFLEGEPIFKWSKALWVGIYGVAVAAFVIVVVPMGESWGDMSAPVLGWTTLFLVFALFAVGVWAYFKLRPTPAGEREEFARSVADEG